MSSLHRSSAKPNSQPQAFWILTAVVSSLLATIVGSYIAAWQEGAVWHWVPTTALGYLVPVALMASYFGRSRGIAVSLVGVLTIIPLIGIGWQQAKPSGALVGLGIVALILPAVAYLLGVRADPQRRQETLAREDDAQAKQTKQITCLAAIGNAFRIGKSLPEMLHLAAQSIGEGVGFKRVLISLVEGEPPTLRNVAAVGFPPSDLKRLQQMQDPLSVVQDVMREEFRISQSYYVPNQCESAWLDTLCACSPATETRSDDDNGLLIVPIYGMAHKIVGIIAVDQPLDGQAPDQASVETLQVCAQQAAIAMDNYRLQNDLQRRAENMALINEVGQTITSGLESQSVLEGIVAASAQLLGSNYSALFFWDDESQQLTPQVAYGFSLQDEELFSEPQLEELTALVIKEGRSVIVPDIDNDSRFSDSPAQRLGIKSMLMVPLVEAKKASGTLVVGATRESDFDHTDQVLLSTLADQASVAIQNARLYENTALRVNQLATLNDLGKTIISSLDMDVTLAMIMDKVQEALNVESGSLLLVEKGRLVFRTSFGPAGEQVKPFTLEMGQGIAGWVALTGKSVLVPDVKKDERHFAGIDQATAYETRSLLCVSLKGPENQVIGVLEIMNPLDRPAFTEQDQELLESVATFAVVAIQNAQLYEQTIHHVTDLSSLYEVGKGITSTLDIEDTLQMTVDETARLTEATRSQIILIDDEARRVTHVVQHGYDAHPPVTSYTYEQARQGINGWTLGEKTPTLSLDIYEDERMHGASVEHFVGKDARSVIIAPLLIKGQPVGTLSAVRLTDTDPFAERELGLLNMLAGQASIAIENAHFFEERKRQITELSILNQTGQALRSTLELEDLMELIHSQVARVVDTQNFYIALYDPEQQVISFPLAYEHGELQVGPRSEPVSSEWLPRRGRKGLTEYIIETRKHLWLPNRVQERLAELGLEQIGAIPLSWMGVPILADDRVLGVITVQSYDQENTYDQEHLDLLMTIASQASVAIRNAQLFAKISSMTENLERLVTERTEALAQANQELRVERDRLNALHRITHELTTSLDPERMLNRALTLINQSLNAEHGYILVRAPDNNSLEYKAAVGTTTTSPEGKMFPSPHPGDKIEYQHDPGLIRWLVSRREPIRIRNMETDQRWHIVKNQDQWHRSGLAAPLLQGEDVMGVILLYHNEPDYYTVDHLRMLNAITSQVAISVSNAEMFRLLREAADRLGTMLRSQQLEAAKSRAILEGVADGVMFTDARGGIILLNAAAERILETPRADVIGRSILEMPGILNLAGTSWPELARRWGGGDIGPEQEVLYDERLEIEDRVISMRVAPVIRQNEFEGTVAVFRDITKDVEVDRMKSDFVSNVSHELRTPMTSIKGYIDLLYGEMAGPLSKDQRRFLQIVKSNADRLTLLVNDLLEVSRIDTGRLELTLEVVDPVTTVNNVLTDLTHKAMDKGQVLHSLIRGPLLPVRADPARMTQILTNLVDNAIKYTPTGGQITVDAQIVDDFLHIHVTDNGIGIAKADQKKLFGRFFRADNPLVQASSGTGLGLHIVKSFVELHGGEMWFDSALGEGSTFSFSLPLAEEQAGEMTPREFKTISYRAQDKHILVVEDEVDDANLIAHQLRSQGGYRVHVVRSGRGALDHLASDRYPTDLVTLDLRLPDMDGIEVLQKIRNDESISGIPVVIVSILSREQDGKRLGAKAYLSKPIEAGHLLSTINDILREQAKVLVVEDDLSLASLFQQVLEKNGFTVITRHDGRQVISTVKAEQPELILLDIKLPGMNGYEILSKLKDTPETRDILVIVITGSVTDADKKRRQALDMGAVQFLTKPLDIEDLIFEIQKVLSDDPEKLAVPSN